MNTVYFESLGLRLSKIAFGCAPVMGRIGRAQSLRAMHTAFDAGVTHFDVARSYGYGEAENVLGAFAADKRDRITIATKFGIAPPKQQRALRLIKPLVRQITRHVTSLRSLVRSASTHTLTAGAFDLPSARRSFDDSLRALKMDYVDMLFLHDCSPDDPLSDELLSWLESLVRAGKARTWGIATQREWIDHFCTSLQYQPRIVQYQNSISDQRNLAAAKALPAILHSPFGGASGLGLDTNRIRNAFLAVQSAANHNHALQSSQFSQLLLESAVYLAENNVVLCSMFDPRHIRMNVDAVERPLLNQQQIRAFVAALTSVTLTTGGESFALEQRAAPITSTRSYIPNPRRFIP